jgi:hypothetical protein
MVPLGSTRRVTVDLGCPDINIPKAKRRVVSVTPKFPKQPPQLLLRAQILMMIPATRVLMGSYPSIHLGLEI